MKIDKRSKEWKQAKKVAYELNKNISPEESNYKGYMEIEVLNAYYILIEANEIKEWVNADTEEPDRRTTTDTQVSNDSNIPQEEESALESFPEGLGDKLETILEKTGVKKAVEWLTDGKDCGCDGRKKQLNNLGVKLGITRRVECLLEKEYQWIKTYNKRHNPKNFSREDVFDSIKIYSRVFNKRPSVCRNCNSGVKQMNNIIHDLNKLVDFYEEDQFKELRP